MYVRCPCLTMVSAKLKQFEGKTRVSKVESYSVRWKLSLPSPGLGLTRHCFIVDRKIYMHLQDCPFTIFVHYSVGS